jgi:hypothetical protein
MPTEPTLLEQLDAAEARLVHAEGRLHTIRRDPFAPIVETRAAEVDVMVAAAHAQITAARCAVAVEEAPDAE